jgi:hypothetical protein
MAFVRGPRTGTMLSQIAGSNLDLIRFAPQEASYAPGTWIGPFGISDMTLLGSPYSSGGHGIATYDATGSVVKVQDLSTLDRLCIRGFAGDGIHIRGAGPIIMTNIATVFNGGYGIRLAGSDSYDIQSCSIVNYSADGNSGGAGLRVENIAAPYSHTYVALKSEQRVNSDRGGALAQANVVQFHNCAHQVVMSGMQHISSGSNTTKPGDAVLITGSVRPTITPLAFAVRILDFQTGPDPLWIRDEVTGAHVERGGPVLSYSRASETTAEAQLRAALVSRGLVVDATTE